ncbi:MAG: protein kinase domain-containing protein [Planctomycetota bacterium]|jgi:hypothetical protein
MPGDSDARLGKLAVERGLISGNDLARALVEQRMAPGRALSDVLVSKGLIAADAAAELARDVDALGDGASSPVPSATSPPAPDPVPDGASDGAPANAPDGGSDAEGAGPVRIVGDYEVVSEMGRGGMGELLKARGRAKGESVGVEAVPAPQATDALVARWLRDSELARGLDYAGAAKAVEFGRDEKAGCFFWAMELVEGETVLARTERLGRLPESEAVGIGRHMASALRHAREAGLTGRAAVPANIMLTPRGIVKLLNVGLVLDVAPDVGDPPPWTVELRRYAAPELAQGLGGDDERADIYSLGACLYHMATGRPPFGRTDARDILAKQVRGQVPWPSDVNPAVSAGLSAVIARMMAKDPAERFATLTEARLDLDIVGQGLEPVIASQPPSRSTVAPPSGGPAVGRATPLPTSPATREMRAQAAGLDAHEEADDGAGRRKLILFAIGGVCATIGLALLVFALVYGGRKRTRREPRSRGTRRTSALLPEDGPAPGDRTRASDEPPPGTGLRRAEAASAAQAGAPAEAAVASAGPELPPEDVAPADDAAEGTARAPATPAPVAPAPAPAPAPAERPQAGTGEEPERTEDSDLNDDAVAEAGGPVPEAGPDAAREGVPPEEPAGPSGDGDVPPGPDEQRKALAAKLAEAEESLRRAEAKRERERLSALLAEFDAMLAKSDFAGARARAEGLAAKPELAPIAAELRSAAGVAKALEVRPEAMVAAARLRVRETVSVRTKAGARRGEIRAAGPDGLTLVSRMIINGEVRGETKYVVAWADLTPDEQDRFASDWEPEGADGAVARAVVALARNDAATAGQALEEAGDHPLAPRYRARIAGARSGAAEAAAAKAWVDVERRAAARRLPVAAAKVLLARLDAFEEEHGKTKFAAGLAEEIAAARVRATEIVTPKTMATLTPSDDTFLDRTHRRDCFGGSKSLKTSLGSPILMRFDLAPVPKAVKVVRATLSLYVLNGLTRNDRGVTVVAHAILPANAGWREGERDGRPGGRDESCWLFKGPGRPWAGERGLGTAGADFDPKPVATLPLPAPADRRLEVDVDPATVQAWVDAPESNHGIVLRTSTGYHPSFASKEALSRERRPRLLLEIVVGGSR